MIKCKKCNQYKDERDFYKHPLTKKGYNYTCKECTKKAVRKNYRKNIDYYKNYDQVRNQKRKEYIKKKNAEYQKNNPEKFLLAKQKWVLNNKVRRATHILLDCAIKSKKIKKGVCQICKSNENIEGHHFDYGKPLNVIWLCKKHHEKIHWWLRRNKRNKKELI